MADEQNLSPDERIRTLEEALEGAPDHPLASKLLAEEYLQQEKRAKAIPLLNLWASSVAQAGNTEEAAASWTRVGK